VTVKEAFEKAGYPVPTGTIAVKCSESESGVWVCFSDSDIFLWDVIFYPARGWDWGVPVRYQHLAGWNPRQNLINEDFESVQDWLPKEVLRRLDALEKSSS